MLTALGRTEEVKTYLNAARNVGVSRDDVREVLGPVVFQTVIPRNVRISEAPSYGKPVLVYDLKCVGSEAYLKLATEVIQRERELRTTH